MKSRLLSIGGWLILFVAAVLAHEGHAPLPSKGLEVDRVKGRVTLTAGARKALDVATAELGPPAAPGYVLAYATVVPTWTNQAAVSSRLPGRLLKVHVRTGDRIKPGDTIAELESAELLSLQTDWLSVHVALRLAEQTVETLRASGAAITGQSLLDAQTQLLQAQNTRAVAQARWLALGLPREWLSQLLNHDLSTLSPVLPIRSSIGGVVTSVSASTGQVIDVGRPILTITDLSKAWVKINILENDLGRVAAGQTCELRFASLPETVSGVIRNISVALDLETQMAAGWIELDNDSPVLVPGMFGEARIAQPVAAKTKSIPSAALIDDGVDRFVFVVGAASKNADEFLRRSVEVVRSTPLATEIRSGDLYPGDRVVTRGSHELGNFFSPATLNLTPSMKQSIGLRFEPVGMHEIAEVLEVPARIDVPPDRRSAATTAIGGTLESLLVTRDEMVVAGQVLATVFSTELLALQLDWLKEYLAGKSSRQQLNDARAAGNGVPRKRLIELESFVTESRLRRDNLRRRLSIVGLSEQQLLDLENTQQLTPILPIRATQSGAVVHFGSMLGRAVKVDEPIATIHDVTQAWVRGAVSEADWPKIQLDQPVRVRLMNHLKDAAAGRIVRTSPIVSEERTAFFWAEMQKLPDPMPRHDQLALMTIVMKKGPPVPAVPIDGVIRDAGVDYVFVQLVDGTIDRRAVTLGRRDDLWIEVTSGLTSGTQVAVHGVQELQTALASVK